MTAILSDFLAIALEIILVAMGQWFEIAIVAMLALIYSTALNYPVYNLRHKDAEINQLKAALAVRTREHEVESLEQNITITELRAEIARLKALVTCRCGDGFTAYDPGTCGNCMAAKTG